MQSRQARLSNSSRFPETRSPTAAIEACILAGGLSTRMGRPKSRLFIGTLSLLAHVKRQAAAVGLPVRVVRRDVVPRCGPLGGICTGLLGARAEAILFLACDMPLTPPGWLRRILRAEVSSRPIATFTCVEGQIGFPFLLPISAIGLVKSQIERGEFSIRALARELGGRLLHPPLHHRPLLANINTEADLAAARKLVRSGTQNPNPRARRHKTGL